MSKSNLLIIIPAFNEEQMIGGVLTSLPKKLDVKSIEVVIIDDGSTDKTAMIARRKGVKVLSHAINRGLGGALGTGFVYAKKVNADIVVTFDADGQHDPAVLPRVIEPLISKKADVVIGSRMLEKENKMPLARKVVNSVSNIATFLLFNIWTTDSQSGLRAFSKKAIQKINIGTQGMEVSSEIFKEIKRNRLKTAEVAIPAIYTQYSLTKGQRVTNAPNVFWKLIMHRFKSVLNY